VQTTEEIRKTILHSMARCIVDYDAGYQRLKSLLSLLGVFQELLEKDISASKKKKQDVIV